MLDRSGGTYLSTSQSNKPIRKKQLYSRLYQLNQTHSSPRHKENINELLQMLFSIYNVWKLLTEKTIMD